MDYENFSLRARAEALKIAFLCTDYWLYCLCLQNILKDLSGASNLPSPAKTRHGKTGQKKNSYFLLCYRVVGTDIDVSGPGDPVLYFCAHPV
mgnify:CR=1 FL=1